MNTNTHAKLVLAKKIDDALGVHRRYFTMKDVCEQAELNYRSVINNLAKLVNYEQGDAISLRRLRQIQRAIDELIEINVPQEMETEAA